MRKIFVVAALAVATVASSLIVTTDEAQARRWGRGFAFGAAVVGGAMIANGAYERCGWLRHYDRYGNYMGRTWVCNY